MNCEGRTGCRAVLTAKEADGFQNLAKSVAADARVSRGCGFQRIRTSVIGVPARHRNLRRVFRQCRLRPESPGDSRLRREGLALLQPWKRLQRLRGLVQTRCAERPGPQGRPVRILRYVS